MRILKWLFFSSAAVAGVFVLLSIVVGGSPGSVSTARADTCAPGLPHAPGATFETIVSGGIDRQYYVQVPPGYDGTTEMPVVFLFHGHGGAGSIMPLYTRMDTEADAEGFILIYPEGVIGPAGISWWNAFNAPTFPNDVIFVNDIINEVESELCIDPDRIYSTGISNGAMMSVRLACSLSSRIAAVAPVGGVYYPPWSTDLTAAETCDDTLPVPILAIHGSADFTIPFHGGTNPPANTGLRDIEAAIMPDWATHNGCSTTPVMSTAAPGVRLAEYPGCADGATTLLYVVEDADGPGPLTEGGGHQWPDAILDLPPAQYGLNTHFLAATPLIYDFFEAPCVGVVTAWTRPLDDDDCDGFPDSATVGTRGRENFMGTDAEDRCADTTAINDERGPAFGQPLSPWPPDINDSRRSDISDVVAFGPSFNKSSGQAGYNARMDLTAGPGAGAVNISDIVALGPFFNKLCTP